MGINLHGFKNFTNKQAVAVSFQELTDYYQSIGSPVSGEAESYPQDIVWEFSKSIIISTHAIRGSDPLILRNVYAGDFTYDSAGYINTASFTSASMIYYEPDGGEYGYTYKPNQPVIWEDTNSLLSWDIANSLVVSGRLTDEYEKGVEEGVLNGEHSEYFLGDWREKPLQSHVLHSNIIQFEQGYVYRLRNDLTGKFIFSANSGEIDVVTGQGWVNEGAAYASPTNATIDLHRFLMSNGGHFYTANTFEKNILSQDSSFTYEGVAYQVYSTAEPPQGSTPVVRYLSNAGSHLYSTSELEQSNLNASAQWTNEGIAWYGESI